MGRCVLKVIKITLRIILLNSRADPLIEKIIDFPIFIRNDHKLGDLHRDLHRDFGKTNPYLMEFEQRDTNLIYLNNF
jgi:hypothetical protein